MNEDTQKVIMLAQKAIIELRGLVRALDHGGENEHSDRHYEYALANVIEQTLCDYASTGKLDLSNYNKFIED